MTEDIYLKLCLQYRDVIERFLTIVEEKKETTSINYTDIYNQIRNCWQDAKKKASGGTPIADGIYRLTLFINNNHLKEEDLSLLVDAANLYIYECNQSESIVKTPNYFILSQLPPGKNLKNADTKNSCLWDYYLKVKNGESTNITDAF